MPVFFVYSTDIPVITLAASSGMRNVTVWCPSVCLSHPFSNLNGACAHTQSDSPGGSMQRGQPTFRPDNTNILLLKVQSRILVVWIREGGAVQGGASEEQGRTDE